MHIVNTGELKIRGVTAGNKKAVRDAFDAHFDDQELNESGSKECGLDLKRGLLWFDEAFNSTLDDDIREFAADVEPYGVTLEGDVSFFGDYDGFILVRKDGSVETLDREVYAVYTWPIKGLRDMLKQRGYDIVKINKAKKADKTNKPKKGRKQ